MALSSVLHTYSKHNNVVKWKENREDVSQIEDNDTIKFAIDDASRRTRRSSARDGTNAARCPFKMALQRKKKEFPEIHMCKRTVECWSGSTGATERKRGGKK